MEILFVLLVLFFILSAVLRSPKLKGKRGEKKVSRKLAKLVRNLQEFRAFHDVILRTPDGTTQIDHILLSPYGIFVIETKNLTGWIFGGEKQKTWTQVVYQKKKNFQNPIHQNYKHVKALQNLLSVDKRSIINIVVFAGDAKFKTPMPNNTIRIKQLLPYIRAYSNRILSTDDIGRFSSMIHSAVSNSLVSEKEHLTNIKRNRNNPLCPKCGSPMIMRTARKGKNIGSTFWGCSKFPSCRSIKKSDYKG